ncbi:MAG: GntG family PLP-dependent aldolase [bacterium]|nr:GntG family PLP-dependent aldolase [bacterium]
MKTIDLRSDTVTRPTPEMRQIMAEAVVGDDVLGDDPTVKQLESYVADLFEKEASLYCPSGTMANQISLKVHTLERGWELLCDRECHVVNYEVAGPVVHSGLLVNLLTTERGMITAEMVRSNIRQINLHCPRTKLVALENTHNRHGGTILPQEEVVKVREVCDEFDLKLHLDGARIWNAHAANGIPLPELTRPFHSVSVCLSKGLGAPIGSMILGPATFIEKCRRERKLFGGGMRQVGIIAAAGLHVVQNNIPRLVEDHETARYLAHSLNQFETFEVNLERVETNIVVANIVDGRNSQEVGDILKSVDVWALPFDKTTLRFVTHLDVSQSDCEEAMERLHTVLK